MTAFTNPNVADRHSQVQVAALDTGDGVLNGSTSASKEGFFGTTPIAQPSISLGSGTLAQVITALGNLGLLNVTT